MSEPSGDVLELNVVRRVHAGLSLAVSLGLGREIGVLFGPSGAGKTTLLRLIAGLSRPDSGYVRLGGVTLFDAARAIDVRLRERRVGMIFQDDLLFPHLDVAANIRFGLKGWARVQACARQDEIAALCGLEKLMGRRPDTLSGGERQRVGLARALAPRPRMLLCDEPVSALDASSRRALVEVIRTVQRAEDVPTLYVTHSPSEAIAIGTRLFRLEAGRIVAEGLPTEVLAAAQAELSDQSLWRDVRNVFTGRAHDSKPDDGESRVQLDGGPAIILPFFDHPAGARVALEIRSDDILLARHPVLGLSARNQIAGTVEQIITHGKSAEVVVRTGELRWIVSLVASAIGALELKPGSPVQMIIKARGCRVIE